MTEERQQKIEQAINRRQENITIVLENVFDPHNIMAVLRSADAIGILEVFLIRTQLPRRPKFGRRSSSGAIKWVKVHEIESVEECMNIVRKKYKTILGTHLNAESKSLYDLNFTDSVALVFGNEQHGLSEEMLTHLDGNFIIPQMGLIQSLNISVACAVTLFEAYRQKENAGHYNKKTISSATEADLRQFWEEQQEKKIEKNGYK
jgi:tRNA (guanosine-2'-O-)-methyltransferase